MSRPFLPHVITDDSALGGSLIERSLRFDHAANSVLSESFGGTGNQQTFTMSAWIKKCHPTNRMSVFSQASAVGTNEDGFEFDGIELRFYSYVGGSFRYQLLSNADFRDTNGWYHIVASLDTPQATASNRAKIYVNGTQITDLRTADYPSQYSTSGFFNNSSNGHRIGGLTGNAHRLNGYLADVYFIDGQALSPSSFGYTESQTGLWRPKKYITKKINNGTTWSNNVTTSNLAGGNIADVFDGDIYDSATINSSDASNNHFTLSSVNVVASKVTVYVSNAGSDIQVYINGSLVGTVSSGDMTNNVSKPFSFTFTETTVTTIKVQRGGSTSGWIIYGINLNDVMLIDGNTSNVGRNGYHLELKDNSSTSTIGTDTSGNSNNFSASNFNVSGTDNDSVIDTPTNNFPTLNPNHAFLNGSSSYASNGNLNWNGVNNNQAGCPASMPFPSTGKWYWEVRFFGGNSNFSQGIVPVTYANRQNPASPTGSIGYAAYGSKIVSGSETGGWAASFTSSDTVGAALDMDNNQIKFYKNNSLVGTINLVSGYEDVEYLAWIKGDTASTTISSAINFGQQGFTYTPPTGFKALNSKNTNSIIVSTPPIIRPQKHFDILTWSGASTVNSRVISGLEFQPDWVWIKCRSHSSYGGGLYYHHNVWDSVRGPGNASSSGAGKNLCPNNTTVEGSQNNIFTGFYGHVSSFNTDGFTVQRKSGEPPLYTDESGKTYVAWCWKAGGTAVTNNDGSIASQVSANQEAGFSILTYTATNNVSETIGHGLGAKPAMIIVKSRNVDGQDWVIYNKNLDGGNQPATHILKFTNAGEADVNDVWQDTEPTSSVFTVGTEAMVNYTAGDTYVAYCWTEIPGFSKFGRYTGNGSADGTYVHLGFRPALVIYKKISGSDSWEMHDSTRNTHNPVGNSLFPSSYDAESTNRNVDFLSNGFKQRNGNGNTNEDGYDYIYMAFAEQPGSTSYDTQTNPR